MKLLYEFFNSTFIYNAKPREKLGVRNFLALGVAFKTRTIPSEAKIKHILTQNNAKGRQMDMNNKWKHYCTSVHHEIQLLQ